MWWTNLKTLSGLNKSTAIPTTHDSDIYYDDDKDKTELFNDFFARQCELDDADKPTPLTDPNSQLCCNYSSRC